MTAFVSGLAAMSEAEQLASVQAMVIETVHAAAGITVEARDALQEHGVDSLAAVEVRRLLEQQVGSAVTLSATLVFDYPTAAAIARFLLDELILLQGEPESAARCSDAESPSSVAAPRIFAGLRTRIAKTSRNEKSRGPE